MQRSKASDVFESFGATILSLPAFNYPHIVDIIFGGISLIFHYYIDLHSKKKGYFPNKKQLGRTKAGIQRSRTNHDLS